MIMSVTAGAANRTGVRPRRNDRQLWESEEDQVGTPHVVRASQCLTERVPDLHMKIQIKEFNTEINLAFHKSYMFCYLI